MEATTESIASAKATNWPRPVIVLTIIFGLIWLVSAALIRRAARFHLTNGASDAAASTNYRAWGGASIGALCLASERQPPRLGDSGCCCLETQILQGQKVRANFFRARR